MKAQTLALSIVSAMTLSLNQRPIGLKFIFFDAVFLKNSLKHLYGYEIYINTFVAIEFDISRIKLYSFINILI